MSDHFLPGDENPTGNPSAAYKPQATAILEVSMLGLEKILRQPWNKASAKEDSECLRIVKLVERIGAAPSGDSKVYSLDRAADADLAPAFLQCRIGQYELLDRLGEGGMGIVYQARHIKLNKLVALKVLAAHRTKDPGAVKRFEFEMQAVGKLEHPNIVRAMDAGEADGCHYLVMEYVSGIDLSRLVKRLGPLPIAEACEMVRQAAIGLEEVRAHNMVHRDIKPSNLIVTTAGVVKILDLGLALLEESNARHDLSSTGQVMGSFDYIAPEQACNSQLVDIRADIYSLGATLFKLLTGDVLFSGTNGYSTPINKLRAHVEAIPPRIRDLRSDAPLELERLLKQMLAKDSIDRPATPAEVIKTLTPLATGHRLTELISKPLTEYESVSEDPSACLSSLVPLSPRSIETTRDKRSPTIPQIESSNKFSRQLPPKRKWFLVATLFGFFGLIFLATIPFFLHSPHGTLQIQIDDPSIEVAVKGTSVMVKNASKEKIILTPGEYSLIVKHGDFEFQTKRFALHKDETATIRVEQFDGKVQVVLGKQSLGAAALASSEASKGTLQTMARGLAFDGKDDYVTFEGLAGDTYAFTIEAWITPASHDTTFFTMPTTRSGAGLQRMTLYEDGLCGALVQNNDQCIALTHSQIGIPLLQRCHVAVGFNIKWHLWFNGKEVNVGDDHYGWNPNIKESFPAVLGMDRIFPVNGGYPNAPFHGVVHEIRISNKLRYEQKQFNPEQVLSNDEQTCALYHFDEGEGDAVKDCSGNNHHGKIFGATWTRGK